MFVQKYNRYRSINTICYKTRLTFYSKNTNINYKIITFLSEKKSRVKLKKLSVNSENVTKNRTKPLINNIKYRNHDFIINKCF